MNDVEWWNLQEQQESSESIHENQKKRFCIHGHDTHIVGRSKRWCNECKRLTMKNLYRRKNR